MPLMARYRSRKKSNTDLVHQSENTMMYQMASFVGHNATGCINPQKRGHEFHELHENIRVIRGEFL